jgi:hypothetical protein
MGLNGRCMSSFRPSPLPGPLNLISVAVTPVSPAVIALLDDLGGMFNIYTGSARRGVHRKIRWAAACQSL